MKKFQRVFSTFLSIVMLIALISVPASATSINDSNVFLQQNVKGSNGTCTLASMAMLLRRYAILNETTDWTSITETSIKPYAWLDGVGLYNTVNYCGIKVEMRGLPGTVSVKKEQLIPLLKNHPEGIIIYRVGVHAVLLTDYDASTDTFYCADPAKQAARIPLASSTFRGNSQDEKISNITCYWRITNNSTASGSGNQLTRPTSSYSPTFSTISEGVYTFTPQCATGSRLDINGGTSEDRANAQIYHALSSSKAQKFKVTSAGGGYYTIICQASGKALDVDGANTSSGTNVQQYTTNGTDAQKWAFELDDDGYYRIIPKVNTGLCLDVNGRGTDDHTNVQVYTRNSSSAQKWKLTAVDASESSTLKISPTAYPTGSLPQGSYFSIKGTVQSNYDITSVKGEIIDSRGNSVCSYTQKPNAKSFSFLNSQLDYNLTFNKLEPGVYYLKYTATDASSKKVTWKSAEFSVPCGSSHIKGDKVERKGEHPHCDYYRCSACQAIYTDNVTHYDEACDICNPPSKDTPAEPSGHWGDWSNWSDTKVSASSTLQVETRQVEVTPAHTEYRYGNFTIDGNDIWDADYGYSLGWSGSLKENYTQWSTKKLPKVTYYGNGDVYHVFCGSKSHNHKHVAYTDGNGYACWYLYREDGIYDGWSRPYYYWEETRTVEATYKTQYRYREWVED